ncbi:mechanosensitive ion channel family protein [Pleurocapsa sp. FMAR1]|uniref:mechanosensitive ion channel family protein n=1 Tax=Pleurocapsa sp. FMAR1 TaxID=3040204 RepID=UPI0029C99BEB|nr:mechanosensitive ion channel family protein [Pleurocapsa sp. FMAR1]
MRVVYRPQIKLNLPNNKNAPPNLMISKKFLVTLFALFTVIIVGITPPAVAQLPYIQDIAAYSRFLRQVQEKSFNSACIRLDGRCLFKLSAIDSELLSDRIDEIQKRFAEATASYLADDDNQPKVIVKPNGNLQDIYLVLGDQQERLFTVTNSDATANDVSVPIRARQLSSEIEQGLEIAKKERSPQYLRKKLIIGLLILAFIWVGNFPLTSEIRKLGKLARRLAPKAFSKTLPLATQLAHRQKWNITEIQFRLLQLVQVALWGGGTLYVLNLFPQTRIAAFLLIAALRIPLRIGLIVLATYILIRLSYFLIAKLSAVAIASQSAAVTVNQRGKLRINTTTRILRSTITILWSVIGILSAFWINGVNLAPILAGAGILGLGLSLASQNLIKDAINGFIIIWDDRYAVGDIVDIGGVSGLVENINLRITQLRDAEGRLITVPNSVVEIVANRSSLWSRADITIPVAYQTDIDHALDVIDQVAKVMTQNPDWQERIWEFPNILGIEQFSDRGILIRVWIKTEPLQQWDVAREFRRRIKIAFDQAGIPIPIPQQQILFDKKKIISNQQNLNN